MQTFAHQQEDKVRPIPRDLLARFMERKAWAGVDLSMTTDMTAASFVFPEEDGAFSILPFFWMPEEGLKKREIRDGMPYRTWADQGFLELSPGNVIDYRDCPGTTGVGREDVQSARDCL
jgi:phage terminase large subunit-like protein